MDVALYTGNGGTQTISGLGFSPDLAWFKRRDVSNDHALFDAVRGAGKFLLPNAAGAESTDNNSLISFNTDGVTIGQSVSAPSFNISSGSYVAWTWDAGSSTVTNTDGSITSSVRANASAGFSIVTFTAQSSGSGTIGHGLGVTPEFVIVKSRDAAYSWIVWHKSLTSAAYSLILNTTAAQSSGIDAWANTLPTSSVLSLGSAYAGAGGSVAYCFAPVEGYSAFGSYEGNNLADGPFVYTGFRPRWILIKAADYSADWLIIDTEREEYNAMQKALFPNRSYYEAQAATALRVDALSNGFKIRSTDGSAEGWNYPNNTHIYAAFAESPMALNNRAR